MIQDRFDVLLVGAGAAATATAMRVLQFTSQPLSIAMVERFPQRGHGGLAYGGPGTTWHDVFNIQAGRMSIFREDVDDFLRWANDEADRHGWPDDWAEIQFTVSGPAPRRIYRDYLADRLHQAQEQAPDGTILCHHVGEVHDIALSDHGAHHGVHCRVQDGTGETVDRVIWARQIIIATGHEFRGLPFAEACADHLSFVRLQYSADGVARLAQVGERDTVFIIGAALSGHDAAISLSRDFGHRGKIYMLSRHGLGVQTYPADHTHAVIQVRRPPFLDKGFVDRETLIEDVTAEWRFLTAWLTKDHPEIAPSVYSERILKAWEPYIAELIAMMPPAEVRRLLDEFNTVISNLRVPTVPYDTNAIADCDLTLLKASIDTIEPREGGELTVRFRDEEGAHAVEADLVIANLNRATDYTKVTNPLWRNLIDRHRLATPHATTGRGVTVAALGELVDADGEVSHCLAAVGLPREGDEIARHGRLGPFAFNVATLKNHSIATALRTVMALEGLIGPGGTGAITHGTELAQQGVPEADRQAFVDLLDPAAASMVFWLTARTRTARQQASQQLDVLQRALVEKLTGLDAPDAQKASAVRACLLLEAVQRMTDVSVTPRELRQRLGLAEGPPASAAAGDD